MTLGSGAVQEGIHYFEVRVYYENTDAGGVVYHSEYLNFAERARTELLRFVGISQEELNRVYACVLVVSQLNIKYEKAARLDAIIQVRTVMESFSKASFNLAQSLWVGEERIAKIKVSVVVVDSKTWHIRRLPAEVTKKIKEGLDG
jgi:acyl-CoA thioester hydrolase